VERLEARELLTGTYPGFSLDNSGNLYNTGGEQPLLIDTAVRDFAVVNDQVFDLHLDRTLAMLSSDGSGKVTLDGNVQAFVAAGDGSVFDLNVGGSLKRWTADGGLLGLDQGVLSFAVTPLGVVYELNAMQRGVLLQSGTGEPGSFQQIGPGNTRAFAMAPDGTAYALGADGVLRRNGGGLGGNCLEVVDSGVQSFVIAGLGSVFDLRTSGSLILLNADGSSQLCGLSGLSVTSWTVGRPGYSGSITISGGIGTNSNLVVTGLPPGLNAALSGNTITLSGTPPTHNGTLSFRVSVSLASVPWATVSGTYALTLNPGPAASLSVSAPATATVGVPFRVTVTAYDAYGNTATGSSGTVALTSSSTQQVPSGAVTLANGTGSASLTPAHSGAFLHQGPVSLTAAATWFATSVAITVNPSAWQYTFWGQAFDDSGYLVATTVWSQAFSNDWAASQGADAYFAWWFRVNHFDHVRYGLQSTTPLN
jgi:hypothetical protein